MDIASEITRLQTAKADIKTAIEAKGVTVPSSAKLDTYDTYIDQIQTGGNNVSTATIILPTGTSYYGTVYYIDSNGDINTSPAGTPTPYGEDWQIVCLCGSMLVYVYDNPPEPGMSDTLPNCTLMYTITMGSRASHNRVSIFKVNQS